MATMIDMIGGQARRLMLPIAALAVVAVIAAAVFAGGGNSGEGVAEAQSTPPPPANQQARNTAALGEVIVTWNAAANASAYRIGWLNHQDYLAAGSAWLQRFTFADVPTSVRQYRVTRLTPGEEYWFIVASVDANNRMYWPQSWIQKFEVTPAPTPTPCPTTHGPGAPTGGGDGAMCPITGLPIGDGYVEIGSTANWDGFQLTVNEAAILEPGTHQYGGTGLLAGETYEVPNIPGRRTLNLEVTLRNDWRDDLKLDAGRDYVLDTDAGIAFVKSGDRTTSQGVTWATELRFEIPERATVAVLAARPLYWETNVELNEPTLFRIPIPQ